MVGPKIVLGYAYFSRDADRDIEESSLAYIQHVRVAGFDVEGFCLTLNPPGPRLSFPELESRWRRGDRELLAMYERLEERLLGKDVFINASGINLHPEFVEQLPVFRVFQCFDDPESSDDLSKPVARAYDLCLVGNIAEVDTYRAWGVKNVEWTPLGLLPGSFDPTLTSEQILTEERDLDLFMMIDRTSRWREQRMDALAEAFPEAHFYGRGWPRGYLPREQEGHFLRRAKIGPNFHNSTGPINFRTFYLPANGVMQICDNKSHLGKVYELGKEAVGFDTVDECIDLCRYYLAHDAERRQIAVSGWRRAVTDYNLASVFHRKVDLIQKYRSHRITESTAVRVVALQRRRTMGRRIFAAVVRWSGVKYIVPQSIKRAVRAFNGITAKRTPRSDHPIDYRWEQDGYYNELHLRLRIIALMLLKLNSGLVLDIGCGNGLLRTLLPPGVRYCGCDGHWKKPPYTDAPYETWVFGRDDMQLLFAGQSFDAIVCSGILEYIQDHKGLFQAAGSRVQSGGYLLVSAINAVYPRYVLGRMGLPWGIWHAQWRTIRMWYGILRDLDHSGFSPELIVPVPRWKSNLDNAVKAVERRRAIMRMMFPHVAINLSCPDAVIIARKK